MIKTKKILILVCTLLLFVSANNQATETLVETFGDEVAKERARAEAIDSMVYRRTPNSITPFDKAPIIVAADSGEKKATVKYKDYEKIEFDSLDVAGDNSAEGQISITAREQKKFTNPIPRKKNFHPETRQDISTMK